MNVFFDSSALVKRYLEEPGSGEVENLCSKAEQILVSMICLPEIISALSRRRREKFLSPQEYNLIKERILLEFEDFLSCPVTERVIALSVECLEKYSLRAMAAIHLGCALDVAPGLFVSADEEQLKTAKKLKLRTRRV